MIYLTEAISYSPFFKVPSAFTFFTSLFGMGRGALHVAIITNLHCKISEIFSIIRIKIQSHPYPDYSAYPAYSCSCG